MATSQRGLPRPDMKSARPSIAHAGIIKGTNHIRVNSPAMAFAGMADRQAFKLAFGTQQSNMQHG